MKKYFGLLLALVVMVLPLTVNAASARLSVDDANCTDDGDYRICKGALITDAGMPQAKVTFTTKGGAEIVSVTADEHATLTAQNGNTYTFVLNDPTVTGHLDLFVVKIKKSGQADCGVSVSFDGKNLDIPVTKPTTPDTPTKPDTPTDNKQTGSTLPYIALGVIALGAVGAFVATRNKSKMYKI